MANPHLTSRQHAFDHAVHCAVAAKKLLSRVDTLEESKTFGLATDNLLQFGMVFACLVHDVDHRGTPNFCLAKTDPSLYEQYKGTAPQEQNSFAVSWKLLMQPEFESLRACIYQSQEELVRFRQVMAKTIVATEIFDTDLSKLRLERWQQAFGTTKQDGIDNDTIASRKANAVMELVIQASDVSHTMQNWSKYIKWNQSLFQEMYKAYKAGHLENDPSVTWYEGELKFFDTYVIPLATRVQESGVFDASGDDCLRFAKRNRSKWADTGKTVVNGFMLKNQHRKVIVVEDPIEERVGASTA